MICGEMCWNSKGADNSRQRQITELFVYLFSSNARFARPDFRAMMLIATAESQQTMHPLLNITHIFQQTVELKPPSKDARADVRLI